MKNDKALKLIVKLVYLDRKTGEPLFKPNEVKPQFVINLDELYRTSTKANPSFLPKELDLQAMISAEIEMFARDRGADVYFRLSNSAQWKRQESLWKPSKTAG